MSGGRGWLSRVFVPYGGVVRLRRQCRLAWALMLTVLIVALGGRIDVLGSSGAESHPGGSQPANPGHREVTSVRQMHRVPRLGSPFATFYLMVAGQIDSDTVTLLQVGSN